MVFRRLIPIFFTLLSSSLFLSCTTTPEPLRPMQTSFYIYRFDPAAFVEFSNDLQPVGEIPFSIPLNCSLFDIFPTSIGSFLLIELSCPNGQTVLFLDTESGSITQPIPDTDSHFLAWANNGRFAYLKVDSLGNARVVRTYTDGKRKDLSITGWTYDLSAQPNADNFIFSFSRGLGSGSELTLAQNDGRDLQQLYVDRL